jgi:hypothetical protein
MLIIMKKILFLLLISIVLSFTNRTFAQLIDEKNVTITMDLQPILQLNMTTPNQVDFVFDKISDYYSGVIKYGATVLKVSSSVSWDLYAVGSSTNGTYWDQQVAYGATSANRINNIPLSALELHQYGPNTYIGGYTGAVGRQDYSTPFLAATSFAPANVGQNSIFYSATPYVAPTVTDKYIQGSKGTATAAPGDGAPGGSYLTATVGASGFTDYYFVIDYRIVPGLPAIFPFAGTNAAVAEDIVTANAPGDYASPGAYSMDVKFVLLEDQ